MRHRGYNFCLDEQTNGRTKGDRTYVADGQPENLTPSPTLPSGEGIRPMSHLRFYRAILSRDKVAVCDMHSCMLQLCRAIKLRDKIAR